MDDDAVVFHVVWLDAQTSKTEQIKLCPKVLVEQALLFFAGVRFLPCEPTFSIYPKEKEKRKKGKKINK